MSDRHSVSGAVLAGGNSRRMGTDKRWILVAGVPMLVRAVDALHTVADDVFVVGAAGKHEVPVPVITDRRSGQGPVAGIETALANARHPVVLVVAVDHPWLASPVLELLVERLVAAPTRMAAVLGTATGPQPLIAAWRATARHAVGRLLDGGERRAMSLIDRLPVEVVPVSDWLRLDPEGRTATDVDTPDELGHNDLSSDHRTPTMRAGTEV